MTSITFLIVILMHGKACIINLRIKKFISKDNSKGVLLSVTVVTVEIYTKTIQFNFKMCKRANKNPVKPL